MEYIEVAIKIPEEDFKAIKEDGFNGYADQRNRIAEAIANGTPLPISNATVAIIEADKENEE